MKHFRSVGFIGGGRVTRLLLEGWKKADVLPEAIEVSDTNDVVLKKLCSDFPMVTQTDNRGAAACELLVLAVHPPAVKEVLSEIGEVTRATSVVLSLVPKMPISGLQSALGTGLVVRMIPNAAAMIGMGYNPRAMAGEVDDETRGALEAVFSPWGACPEVEEGTLEAYAILSAMGPTYFWFQLAVLRELGGEFGLSQVEVDKALSATVHGATACLLETGWSAEEVMDMIPVKPLAEHEDAIRKMYRDKLTALFEKLKV